MGRISNRIYRCIRFLVWVFYPKTQVEGVENLPDGPCVIVGNHAQMNGPIACELYLPGEHYTWCAQEMMHLKEVPAYAYRDFWSGKPGHVRWLFRIASYLIAPIAVCVFNNANCIGVYRDARGLRTFRQTLERLSEGARIVIFPEENVPYNGLLWRFQSGFVDLGHMYRARTRRALTFVPMYVAPAFHKLVFGRPVAYDPEAPAAEERERVCAALADEITRVARSLPPHTVVPYPNMPKKNYPRSRPEARAGNEG